MNLNRPSFVRSIEGAQKFFFDRAAVAKSIDKARVRSLSKFGASTRRAAQTSMRPGGKKRAVSAPGEPPRSHGKRLLRKHLYFSYDPATRSVVVGPAKLNWVNVQSNSLASATIPEVLEFGGSYRIFEERYTRGRYSSQWFRVDLRRRNRKAWLRYTDAAGGRGFVTDEHGARRETRLRTINMQARPFMRPALKKVSPKFPEFFKGSVRG